MKTINVVAAVIVHDSKVFATQRGYGEFAGGWEFPGGKVEAGETPEQALVREIREELETTVSVDSFVYQVEYDYPAFHLSGVLHVLHRGGTFAFAGAFGGEVARRGEPSLGRLAACRH